MKTSRTQNRDVAAQPAKRMSFLAPTLLIAAAAIITPILAGVPEEIGWTCLADALTLFAIAWILFFDKQNQPESRAARFTEVGCLGLTAVAVISLASRIVVIQHGATQYIDPMMHGVAYWTTMASLAYGGFVICRRSREHAYFILIAMVAAGLIVSAMAVQDYLREAIVIKARDWREFGTSEPDYFAGYLIIAIPIALGLFLNAPAGTSVRAGWLFALAFVLELAALPTTGSRFALISLAVLIIVFIAALVSATKSGMEISKALKSRLAILGVLAVLGGGVFAGPLIHRLNAGALASQANSGAFRVYTWKGGLRLWEHYPLFGDGPFLFAYIYPEFATVGYTREAHSGYLQVLDDIGPLGNIAIALIFVGSLWSGAAALRNRRKPEESATGSVLLKTVAPESGDDRIVMIGLASGIIGSLVQNTIDSDWNITICGVTLFLAAGVLLGLSASPQEPPPDEPSKNPPIRVSMAAVAALLGIACFIWSIAGFEFEAGNYAQAAQIEPLSGDFTSSLGWKVEFPAGDVVDAERNLSAAINDAPKSVWYYRRGAFYDATSRTQQALSDVDNGLKYDPNSLELLLLGAQISDEIDDYTAALRYYGRMTVLQTSPYGLIPAIGELVDYHYAYADYAVGLHELQIRQPKTAQRYLTLSEGVLEEYIKEGGTSNSMRMAEVGAQNTHKLELQLQGLYDDVMPNLVGAYLLAGDKSGAAQARARREQYDPQFSYFVQRSAPK